MCMRECECQSECYEECVCVCACVRVLMRSVYECRGEIITEEEELRTQQEEETPAHGDLLNISAAIHTDTR